MVHPKSFLVLRVNSFISHRLHSLCFIEMPLLELLLALNEVVVILLTAITYTKNQKNISLI